MINLKKIKERQTGQYVANIIYQNDKAIQDEISATTSNIASLSADSISRLNEISSYSDSVKTRQLASLETCKTNIATSQTNINAAESTYKTNINDLNKKIDEIADLNTTNAEDIESIKDQLNRKRIVGMIRLNGSSSPLATETFGDDGIIHEIGMHLRMSTIKEGKLTHYCKNGRITEDISGNTVAIDGSEGDIVLTADCDLYLIKGTGEAIKYGTGTVQYNVIGIGLEPMTKKGISSKKIAAHAICCGYTVNGQLSYDKYSTTAHYCYNTSLKGHFTTLNGVFNKSYKTSGAGYPSQYVSCVQSIQYAQSKNGDQTKNTQYIGMYYEYYELLLALMYSELKTVQDNRTDLIGCGCTPLNSANATTFHDVDMSGNSGWRIIYADGTVHHVNAHGYEYALNSSSSKITLQSGIGCLYALSEMCETQRLLDGITKAGLIDCIGNYNNFFKMDSGGTVSLVTDIDVMTGEGMEEAVHYYNVRNVPGCEGMNDGVMTAVINRYTKCIFNDGFTYNGTLNSVANPSLDGAIAILKASLPIYRGVNIPLQGLFWQTMGAYYVIYLDADSNKTVKFECADSVDDIPALTTFGSNAYQGSTGTTLPLESGLTKSVTIPLPTFGEGWMKTADYSMSLWCYTSSGGGSSTYESAYLWLYPSNNAGAGNKQIHGSVVGCSSSVWHSLASARTADCVSHAGYSFDLYAGAFAVLNITYA